MLLDSGLYLAQKERAWQRTIKPALAKLILDTVSDWSPQLQKCLALRKMRRRGRRYRPSKRCGRPLKRRLDRKVGGGPADSGGGALKLPKNG